MTLLAGVPFQSSITSRAAERASVCSQPALDASHICIIVKLGWKVHLSQAGSKDFMCACGGPGTEPGLEQVHRLGAQTYFCPKAATPYPLV